MLHVRAYTPSVDYEWDSDKARANFGKHGVRFADAVGVLEDEMALSREDLHAVDERRFVAIGSDFLGRILTVVYTYREKDRIRLISARRATRGERRAYEKGRPMSDEISEMRPEYDMRHARRGPVVAPEGRKTRITIRIDNEVVEWFRDRVHAAGGGSYQTLMNEALREYIQHQGLEMLQFGRHGAGDPQVQGAAKFPAVAPRLHQSFGTGMAG